ncbi:MAG: PLP-dependent cysteine synthase family protein [Xanthomonadaceae bacterium]|nr:PLP-dependent cysteine synthase family protein [Xanthomonadaceae bacterium]
MMSRHWVNAAIAAIEADFQRSADTHLVRLDLPAYPGIPLYFKDESSHPTGSLKHRLARSLFLYALCNGWLREGQTVIEASSGSTAVSEAYFARLIGLPFIAVMPNTTSREKIARIEFYGGRCHMIEGADVSAASRALAAEVGGHFMDQFTYAERATDWRGNNNIAESIFEQLKLEPHPCPSWIVVSAGTGGTAATMGRYIRYQPTRSACTRLAVVDPEYSVFFDAYRDRKRCHRLDRGSRIEGIGRPIVEASFLPDTIDRMIKVPDALSLAAMRALEGLLGRKVGGSTGTNFVGALQVMGGMKAEGETGAVVTLICDGGERYLDTYYDDAWVAAQGYELDTPSSAIKAIVDGHIASPSIGGLETS